MIIKPVGEEKLRDTQIQTSMTQSREEEWILQKGRSYREIYEIMNSVRDKFMRRPLTVQGISVTMPKFIFTNAKLQKKKTNLKKLYKNSPQSNLASKNYLAS